MANRFYTSFALSPGMVTIQGPEAHHLATVRRFHIGDAVVLFNGDGNEYAAEIVSIDRKAIALNVLRIDQVNRELPIELVIACAVPKGDRADFLVEKLTELGATELVPLETGRSVVKPREAKIERWSRAVIEASKQCGRNRLMQIQPMIGWSEFCRQPRPGFRKLLADPQASQSALPQAGTNVCFAVGPEGGFSDDEIALAREAGWETVSLGLRTLRVETAAIALAALFAFHR